MGIDVPSPEEVASQVQAELGTLGARKATSAEIHDVLRSERESTWHQMGNGVSVWPGTEPRLVRVEFQASINPYKDGQRPAIANKIRQLTATIRSCIPQDTRVNFHFEAMNSNTDGPITIVTVLARGVVETDVSAPVG